MQISVEKQAKVGENDRSGPTERVTAPSNLTSHREEGGHMAESDHNTTGDKSPAFQFYPKDYLSDAKTRAMTFKQRGMYWDLVCHCWLEGGLPGSVRLAAVQITRRSAFGLA